MKSSVIGVWTWRCAALGLLVSIWWFVGGGDWAKRTYWAVYFSLPGSQAEQPKAGGSDPLEFGSEKALQDLAEQARAEAASTPQR